MAVHDHHEAADETQLDADQLRTLLTAARRRERAALDLAEEQTLRLQRVLDGSHDVIVSIDSQGRVLGINQAAVAILGCETERIVGKTLSEYIHPDDLIFTCAAVQHSFAGEPIIGLLNRYQRADGEYAWFEWNARILPDAQALICIGRDVSERIRTEEALRQQEQRYRAVADNSTDLLALYDATGQMVYASPSCEGILGYTSDELRRTQNRQLVHPDDLPQTHAAEAAVRAGKRYTQTVRLQAKSGEWVWLESVASPIVDRAGQVVQLLVSSRDVRVRKRAEEQLEYQAFHDALTGLPNRALFMDRLAHALARGTRRSNPLAVLFLDVDNFKLINDSLGHDAGDQLLIAVGQRLRTCLRPEDSVARFGGDEFAILLEEILDVGAAEQVAARIAERYQEPFLLRGREVYVTFSIGIAPGARKNRREDLLRNADMAMYRAKQLGRANYAVFEPTMDQEALVRLELGNDLRRALERQEFKVYYQPVVELESGTLVGMEALLRWQHPQRGLVLPAEFIPLAEESGLILPIGHWVLLESCQQARAWQLRFPADSPLFMCVNLSVKQLQQPNLVRDIAAVLKQTDLAPGDLHLEITESHMMQDAAQTLETLHRLKQLGVKVAIDDFGTGYSSLSYLKRFPVDILKVDRSFVTGLGEDPDSDAIVQTVIALAKALKLTVQGEGVESQGHMAQLRSLHCERGQGYYFARPLPGAEIERLLAGTPHYS